MHRAAGIKRLSFVLVVSLWASTGGIAVCQEGQDNPHFLRAPGEGTSQEEWLAGARQYRSDVRDRIEKETDGAAGRNYQRPDLAWMSRNFTCAMCMLYSTDFYDPEKSRYLIDDVLADGEREFGGYDSIVLWHAYPRLGIDQRNQFDFYRDMPGGLAGLRSVVERCHERDVRVFVDYNPWDTGTRRESQSDYEALASIASAIGADGIFLDTLDAGSAELRRVLDGTKPGLAIVSEGHPAFEQLAICSGSWGQWLDAPESPGILRLKWVEPRHVQYQIRRWDRSRSDEIATAFFNGSGVLVWENVFGTYNPWTATDRHTWKKAHRILEFFADCLSGSGSHPYYPSRFRDVSIHRWQMQDYDLFLLQNEGEPLDDEVVFDVPAESSKKAFNLWTGQVLDPQASGGRAAIRSSLDKLCCILVLKQDIALPGLEGLLEEMAKSGQEKPDSTDPRNFTISEATSDPVEATKRVPRSEPPPGMVFVPGTTKVFRIEHKRGECGCYPDSVKEAAGDGFGYGLEAGAVYPSVIHERLTHTIGPLQVDAFFIDEAEVTNAQFKEFLERSGYQPKHDENFLKHWPDGEMPESLADHPVVYIDIDDARAYATWAGKRLPTEFEWQLAAQGPGDRTWPWGDEFDAAKCNSASTTTVPARSCPDGRSPYGCYHMAGNVWEWTESCRNDGHTRYTMIRGGSYFKAEGSIWYVEGGAQPCGHHAKFIRMWPGLDRCGTVGFRCVVDVQ